MYDASEVLRNIDDHVVWVLLLGTVSIVGNLIYYVAMARASSAAGLAPMTLLSATVFLAHDGGFVAEFDKWFNKYDHWFPQLFWAWLVVTVCFAVWYVAQIARYGKKETPLPISQQQWYLVCVGAAVSAVFMWLTVKSALDDDLYLLSFMLTQNLCAISGLALLIRRGDARGQSAAQWWGFLAMCAGFFGLTQFLEDSSFQSPLWFGCGLFNLASGLILLTFARQFSHRDSPASPPVPEGHRV